MVVKYGTGDIMELPSAWRHDLMLANYNGAYFHCEANSRESGRRIVEHEFPKKELPYAEDMGRHAREFTIRGYCVVYPFDRDVLRRLDYRQVRDALITQLEAEGPGVLQLPTQPSQIVVCPRYRMTEEEKFGGYCVLDMTFQEYGIDPQQTGLTAGTATIVNNASKNLIGQANKMLAPPISTAVTA